MTRLLLILLISAIAALPCRAGGGACRLTPADAAPVSLTDAVVSVAAPDTVALLPTTPSPWMTLYDLPYSMTLRLDDWHNLWVNTGVLFAGGFTALGVLELLPEDATAWNKKDQRPLFKRYADHFRAGPVWDGDKAIFNAVLHPYAGAAYYMSARSQGFNILGSLAYCVGISTVFWEYGIECFMEVPSIQDLVVTPLGGAVLGEAFYLLKRHIVHHDYRLFGSPVIGNIVAFIIDPVNEVIGLFRGNPCRRRDYVTTPAPRPVEAASCIMPVDGGLCFSINLTF